MFYTPLSLALHKRRTLLLGHRAIINARHKVTVYISFIKQTRRFRRRFLKYIEHDSFLCDKFADSGTKLGIFRLISVSEA